MGSTTRSKSKEVATVPTSRRKSSSSSSRTSSSKDKPLTTKRVKVKKQVKDLSSLTAHFGKDSSRVQDLISNNDSDSAIELAQKSMLKMMIGLIPIAETQYREFKNERAAYALNALVSQSRELIADIQSTKDRSLVADAIIANVIHPTFISIGQFIIDSNRYLRKDLAEVVDAKDMANVTSALDKNMRSIGQYLQQTVDMLNERIQKMLVD